MGKLYAITAAFGRSAQFANAIINYRRYRLETPDRHIVVQCHFPVDRERNNEEIRLLCESFGELELIDPGGDIGSAQSQQFALNYLNVKDDDIFLNIDNDSACTKRGWDRDMTRVFAAEPNCVVMSCMSPMVQGFLDARGEKLTEKMIDVRLDKATGEDCSGFRIGIPSHPTPFNLSAFRCSFIREMGGLRQLGMSWGELEAVIYQEAMTRGYYHGYLMDYIEDESGKFFHPKSNADWKDRHMRTVGENNFVGNYGEYLAYYHPEIANMKL